MTRQTAADFFKAGKTYQHPSEGVFHVVYVGTAPAPFEHHSETLGVAFGWQRGGSPNGAVEGLGSYTTPDFHGWTEVPAPDVIPNPDGCRWCGDDRYHHGWQWVSSVGSHQWEQPTQEQRLARMKARREVQRGEHDPA